MIMRLGTFAAAPITSVAALLTASAEPAFAADFGGECCADLEERIAELEATTARKGNRKVSLTVGGHVSTAVLFWDDGFEDNAYVVGNKNDQTNFYFNGEAAVTSDVTAGFAITLRLRDTLSDEVSQDDDDSEFGITLWEANWYLDSKRAGKLTVGQASRVSDTAPENDLSETAIAGYAGVQDIGGAFFLRRKDNALSDVVWGDLISHLNGDTANVVRYDTPTWFGFTAAASYGEDDIWDVGIRYAGEGRGFQVEAAIAYTQSTDENGLEGECCELDNSVIVGSVAVLHEPSGLNALIAAGQQSFDQRVEDPTGVFRTPADPWYVYTKLGLITKWSHLGPLAFYGEYGHFEDFGTAGLDGDQVASLAANGICATPGNCRATGSNADVWGLGVVQTIEAAEMQVYIGYRNYNADFDIVDTAGANAATEGIDSFQTVITGAIIPF
jgi:predicted porin